MSTTTNHSIQTQGRSLPKALTTGAIAGLGGGLIFGLMMGMMGMLPMVSMLVRQENAIVGFVVHMVISAFIGATFGAIATRLPSGWGPTIIGGGIYGIVWWVLGALILMPLPLGMPEMVFAIGGPQWMGLLGHVIYGVITGALFVALSQEG